MRPKICKACLSGRSASGEMSAARLPGWTAIRDSGSIWKLRSSAFVSLISGKAGIRNWSSTYERGLIK